MMLLNKAMVVAILTLGLSHSYAQMDGMQVEEPNFSKGKPPIDPDLEKGRWESHKSKSEKPVYNSDLKKSLNPVQQKAHQDRKRKSQELILRIQEKRKAIEQAKAKEKTALAEELHELMLEKENNRNHSLQGARMQELEKRLELKLEQEARDIEQYQRNLEIQLEIKKKLEEQRKQLRLRHLELKDRQEKELKAAIDKNRKNKIKLDWDDGFPSEPKENPEKGKSKE